MVSTRRINKLADPQTEKEIDNIYNLLSRTGFYFDVLNNRVGIGTTHPDYSLDVRGGDIKVTRGTTSPAMASLAFGSDFNRNYIYGGDQDNNMIFYVNGGERIRINSGGLVGIGTTAPNAYALLDVSSTTKAFMPPRMTTAQKLTIPSPTAGMMVYDSTLNHIYVFNNSTWEAVYH